MDFFCEHFCHRFMSNNMLDHITITLVSYIKFHNFINHKHIEFTINLCKC